MSHIVESCPLTKLNGGLSRLHSADEDAVSWLTTHSLTAALDQLRVVASSTSNDPGPRSRQHQQIGQRLLVQSVVLYGSETWTMRKVDSDRIQSFHMQALRRILARDPGSTNR